jgi:hypothetical protein
VLQFSITPKTRATIIVRGRTLRVPVSAFTATDGGDSASALRNARNTGTAGAFVDRRLTAAERRAWHSQLVWIDGDVLVVNTSNPLCTSGTSRAAARSKLATATRGTWYAPAGLTGDPEYLFGLHPRKRGASGYGKAVRIVDEQAAIGAVASDPTAIAAVAWSAARGAVAAGAVCAVPLGGVTASEATLRTGRYPASVPVSFAWPRRGRVNLPAWGRRWYLHYLRSATVHHLLRTSRGRDRLLP